MEKLQARKAAETRKTALEKKAVIEALPAVKESKPGLWSWCVSLLPLKGKCLISAKKRKW